MIEVELLDRRVPRADVPPPAEIERLSLLAAAAAGVRDGHLAIEFVDSERIAQLNARYRGEHSPTDVLSFPVDGREAPAEVGARELGDIVICPDRARDVREAIVHGVLHLVGFDHETDDGEMLALQRRLLAPQSE
jgi:probable rRNA maturation factor